MTAVDNPTAALAEARRRAAGGLVVVCGSMFLVGPLRAALLGETVDPAADLRSALAEAGQAGDIRTLRCSAFRRGYQPAT